MGKNSLFVIHPYRRGGVWMFDDERVGLLGEPFVAGIPDIIERVIREQNIPEAENGFSLIFSAAAFPGAHLELERRQEEIGGWWYRCTATGQEGWLCPALFNYFPEAPEKLYAQALSRDERESG